MDKCKHYDRVEVNEVMDGKTPPVIYCRDCGAKLSNRLTKNALKLQPEIIKSDCVWGGANKEYRYVLYRVWNLARPHLAIIGLNPSVADEEFDDRTVRRCINFARKNGYGSLVMLNAFAYRSTDPKGLTSVSDPVGQDNDYHIFKECHYAEKIILAWGTHAKERGDKIIELLMSRDLYCFGVNKDGTPKHPLYLPNNVKVIPMPI